MERVDKGSDSGIVNAQTGHFSIEAGEKTSTPEQDAPKIPSRSSSSNYRDELEQKPLASSISNSSTLNGADVEQKSFEKKKNGRKLSQDEAFDLYQATSTLDKVKKVASEAWGILKKTFAAVIDKVFRINTSSNAVKSARQTEEDGHQKVSLESQRKEPEPATQEMTQGRDAPQDGQQMQMAKARDEWPASARDTSVSEEVLFTVDLSAPKVELSLVNLNSQEMAQGRDTPQDKKPISFDSLLKAFQENSNEKESLSDSRLSDSSQKELSQGQDFENGKDLNIKQVLAALFSLKQEEIKKNDINVEQFKLGAAKEIKVKVNSLRLSICDAVVSVNGLEKGQQERPSSPLLSENTPASRNKTFSRR